MCELVHTRCLVRATERDTRTDANVLSRDRWHVEVPKQHKCPSRRHTTSGSRDSLNQHTLSAVTVSLSFLRVRRLLVLRNTMPEPPPRHRALLVPIIMSVIGAWLFVPRDSGPPPSSPPTSEEEPEIDRDMWWSPLSPEELEANLLAECEGARPAIAGP